VVRGWVVFWCVQSFAWAWDAPAAYQPAGQLAVDPYSAPFVLAPNPYPATRDTRNASPLANRRARRAPAGAGLAPSPYDVERAALAPMPYAGRIPEREIARPSSRALALAASPYLDRTSPELAPDPY
jgi:hypothetical protein